LTVIIAPTSIILSQPFFTFWLFGLFNTMIYIESEPPATARHNIFNQSFIDTVQRYIYYKIYFKLHYHNYLTCKPDTNSSSQISQHPTRTTYQFTLERVKGGPRSCEI
jgi:hypothetical protein